MAKHKIAKLTARQSEALTMGLVSYGIGLPTLLEAGIDSPGLSALVKATNSLQALLHLLSLRGLPKAIIEVHFRYQLVPAFNDLEGYLRAGWDRQRQRAGDKQAA